MTDVLKDVVKRGTGRNARVEGIELAGKTGTTNNNIDAWFCGYSPTIETIVWFGRDDNTRIGKGATGGALAAPAFAFYYKKLLELYPETKRTFDIPEGVFRGEYEGKAELYTENSPLPDSHKKTVQNYDEYDQLLEEEMEITEDIDPDDGEIGYAPTINIDEEPVSEEETVEEDDPLHPKRKVPVTPVSNDSGTLF
jgi:penicillin-binding protein 1A